MRPSDAHGVTGTATLFLPFILPGIISHCRIDGKPKMKVFGDRLFTERRKIKTWTLGSFKRRRARSDAPYQLSSRAVRV